jgi:outer membrane protein TolC
MAAQLSAVKAIPALPARVDPGLPLDLIKRRPDVLQSERQLAAATARVGVATGNLFPRVALAGSEGVQYANMGIEHGTHIWSFGPAFYWPFLDFGALDAEVDIADLKSKEQFEVYRRSLLNAVREVDSAVSDFAAQQDSVGNLGNAVLEGQRAVALANERYERGLTDYLNVVDAERQQYSLEAQLVAAQQVAGEDFVAVYKSLGGGWQGYQDVPAVRLPHPAILAMFERLAGPTAVQK